MEAEKPGVKPSDVLDRLLDHLSRQADLFSRGGDPDMTPGDRLLLLRVQLEEDPEDFLCQYQRHVPADMADCLQQILFTRPQRQLNGGALADVDMEAGAEAEAGADLRSAYYQAAIRRSGPPAQHKNRRYQALQRLVAGGEYFSDESMRDREPYLYHKYIGRYLTPEEAAEGIGGGDVGVSGDTVMSRFLLRLCDRLDDSVRYDTVAAATSPAAHPTDSDSSDSDEDADEGSGGGGGCGGSGQLYLPEQKRQLLRHEFTSLMHRRFLAGEDSSYFDYASVDCDDSLDVSALHLQDEEDRYFDEEEPS